MCVGQLGSLLPHVVVPSILAGFLIPEWHLSGAQAGLLAGSGAAGYMLTVPVLATLTDRPFKEMCFTPVRSGRAAASCCALLPGICVLGTTGVNS